MRAALSSGIRGAAADSLAMAAVVLVIALAAWTLGSEASQRVVTHAAIMLTAVAGLQIFSGNTGIVSFGHSAFAGIGAYTIGILTMSAALQRVALAELPSFLAAHELSLWGALGVAVIVGLGVGAVSGALLWRLSGSSASIATLALLIIIYTVLTGARAITRGSQPLYGVPRNVGLWTAVLVAIAVMFAARLFRETPWGLGARAAADDDQGAAAVGVDRRVVFFAAWMLSVAIAVIAGGLLAQFLGAFTPHGFYFDLAFTLLAMLIVGGMRSSLGALAGVAVTTIVIEIVRRFEGGGEIFGVTLPSIFGLTQAVLALSMILIIWRRPEGLSGGAELNLLRRFGSARTQQHSGLALAPMGALASGLPASPPPALASAAAPAPARRRDIGVMKVERLTKRYRGLTAIDRISLEIHPDTITGLIGPNGAGKTTLVNMLSGHAPATEGCIWVGSTSLERAAPHVVARAGIARTFQNIRIFPRMTALENVLVGARQIELSLATAESAARRELTRVGLAESAHLLASSLPHGSRRRLEIARALALEPGYLLLDEPAAGMNPVETQSLMEMLARVRRDRGLGIVLIEHDLRLVMTLCERIVVLDRGKLIADGTPAEIQGTPAVVAAYLGSRTGAKVLGESSTQSVRGPEGLSHA